MEQKQHGPESVPNTGETTLEPTAKLLRYLYIGNCENIFISQRCVPVSIQNLDARLNFINEMAALRFSLPFGIIKKVNVGLQLGVHKVHAFCYLGADQQHITPK